MISYVPFVKAKAGEIAALSAADSSVKESVCPFFDYPRQDKKPTSDEFKASAARTMKKIATNIKSYPELYFDNFDLDDTVEVDGEYNYKFLLQQLSSMNVNVIPVISIDRIDKHLDAVSLLKSSNVLKSDIVAVRLTPDDFLSYEVVEEEIEEKLTPVIELFSEVDIIFDCRVCTDLDPTKVANHIDSFAVKFCNRYNVRRRVASGSSIPASISAICATDSTINIDRNELNIFDEMTQASGDFVFGDYATVSPNYSDLDLSPEILGTVMTPKIVYSHDGHHRIMRGRALRAYGYGQYFTLLAVLCAKRFFRGETYSFGDRYFGERSRGNGSNCTPSTIIKPSVNAHVTYMVKDSPI